MRRIAVAALAAGFAAGALAAGQLSTEEIVEKNAAARGGLDAWREVRTMVWVGHIESAHAPMPSMQFVLKQERPNKTRFEINAMGEKTVRVFDGTHGWKANAGHDGRPQVRPHTIEEVRYAQGAQGIDGPLIDHTAKGIEVTLEGRDEIEGRRAYRLELRLASGETDRLWIDATTFLDIRYDRTPAGAAGGAARVVSTRYRDYKTFDRLQIPSVIETGASAGPGSTPDRMVIERVVVNPPLDTRTFANPAASRSRHDSQYTTRPPSTARGRVAPPDPAPAADPDAGSAPR
jgi:outer membrane lipoprotein-sorting protein